MDDFLPAIRAFIENFQTDDKLKSYRKFVNVYTPHEEDIRAIDAKSYDITELEYTSNDYGGKKFFQFKVGNTSFRIFGEAAEYIKNQSDSAK